MKSFPNYGKVLASAIGEFISEIILMILTLIINYRSLSVSAASSIKKMTWLIFIMGKIKILHSSDDITETAFLLFACLYHAIMLSPSDV